MNEAIQKFVEKNISLIDKRDWNTLYNIIHESNDESVYLYHHAGEFTDLMYKIGFDPLNDSLKVFNNMFVRSSIKKLTIPTRVTEIGVSAFYGCSAQEIIVPEGVKEIPFECFDDCWNLKIVQLPDSIEKIAEGSILPITGIRCTPDSYAEEWGRNHDNYVELIY